MINIKALNQAEEVSEVLDNLVSIKNHVKKFGITKEFLHIVNNNNHLGSSIGLILPYYESEEENIDQIDENDIPEVEIVMEGIIEKIANVIGYFANVYQRIIDFFTVFAHNILSFFISARTQLNIISKLISWIPNPKNLNTIFEFNKTDVYFWSFDEFMNLANIIEKDVTKSIVKLKGNERTIPLIKLDSLPLLGYQISYDTSETEVAGKKITKWSSIKIDSDNSQKAMKSTDQLKYLKWDISNIEKAIKKCHEFIDFGKVYKKESKEIIETSQKAIESYKNSNSPDTEIIISNINRYYITYAKAYQTIAGFIPKLVSHFCMFVFKAIENIFNRTKNNITDISKAIQQYHQAHEQGMKAMNILQQMQTSNMTHNV